MPVVGGVDIPDPPRVRAEPPRRRVRVRPAAPPLAGGMLPALMRVGARLLGQVPWGAVGHVFVACMLIWVGVVLLKAAIVEAGDAAAAGRTAVARLVESARTSAEAQLPPARRTTGATGAEPPRQATRETSPSAVTRRPPPEQASPRRDREPPATQPQVSSTARRYPPAPAPPPPPLQRRAQPSPAATNRPNAAQGALQTAPAPRADPVALAARAEALFVSGDYVAAYRLLAEARGSALQASAGRPTAALLELIEQLQARIVRACYTELRVRLARSDPPIPCP
jgi:hypothetical protein